MRVNLIPQHLRALRPPGRSEAGKRDGLLVRLAAFTLVEVILAIGIATGLLIIALTFYRQAADLRGQILTEAERFAALRLVMDRLAADLRSAQPTARAGEEFAGGSGTLSFTRTTLPAPVRPGAPGAAVSDLARVSFATVSSAEGTNTVVIGFSRLEEPLSVARPPAAPLVLTNAAELAPGSTNRTGEPLTDVVRFVRFRYWDGGLWQEGWTNAAPPPGVEIVLGAEPLPDDATPETYPYEQFRRVVFVPTGVAVRKLGDETSVSSLGP